MYQQNGSMHGGGFPEAEDALSNNFSTIEEQSYPQNGVAALELELQLHHHLEIQEMVHENASNWQDFMATAENGHYAADFHQIFAPALPPPPPSSLLPNFQQSTPPFYDPLLFQSLPHVGGVYTHQTGDDGFEFTATEMGGKNRDGTIKQFSNEKHRRVVLNDKYHALRALVPAPSKIDRASIVADAIDYIHELKRTVGELKGLVERKRCARERLKRPKVEAEEDPNYDGSSSLRSSWLHRKTTNTEVNVRIVDDEITVKLVQQKRINCLLFVTKLLDELHLDLHHVGGGLVGDYYSYLFNSKICEGSIVYASAVANKLIEVVDKQYAAVPPPISLSKL